MVTCNERLALVCYVRTVSYVVTQCEQRIFRAYRGHNVSYRTRTLVTGNLSSYTRRDRDVTGHVIVIMIMGVIQFLFINLSSRNPS